MAAPQGPAVIEKPDVDVETCSTPDRLWSVIVWNDPINLMSYVTYVFQKLFKKRKDRETGHDLPIWVISQKQIALPQLTKIRSRSCLVWKQVRTLADEARGSPDAVVF